MKATELKNFIKSGGFTQTFEKLYGGDETGRQRDRYLRVTEEFISRYGDMEVSVFSAPGRSEISGNHTDHNNGKVLAASISLDIIAVAAKTEDGVVRVKSEGYNEDVIELSKLDSDIYKCPHSKGLVAGMCKALEMKGRNVGGFCACTANDVLSGSGLSSSAAFEVVLADILSWFYNDGKIGAMEMAVCGKYTENEYFGKPSGLLDQAACASGGLLYMDFADEENILTEKLNFDFKAEGYELCVVNTGGSHSDLTDDYAAVPIEMKAVASELGCTVLRQADENVFYARIPSLREKVGDRAVMRAIHFFEENKRVESQRNAIKERNTGAFLAGVSASGNSSFKFLQNIYTTKNPAEQGISLALAIADTLGIVCRVHGGGFAGTMLAFVPSGRKDEYRASLESVFGQGSCIFLGIRPYGAAMTDGKEIFESGTGTE